MRIRQIKPAYWSDALLQKELDADQREFYIGTWMLADDDGWLRLDVVEIAGELYRYEGSRRRETKVQRFVDRLQALGRLEVYPCGHALIPALTRHQRSAAETKKVHMIRDEHQNRCVIAHPPTPADPREPPPLPARNGMERDRNGTVASPAPHGPDGGAVDRDAMVARLKAMAADPGVRQVVRESIAGTLRRYGVDVDAADHVGDEDDHHSGTSDRPPHDDSGVRP